MDGIVKMHSERNSARKRYFSEKELRLWFQALPAAGEYQAIHELLMRTLCRFSDILNLTWGEVVERENGDIVLTIGETKNDLPHVAYLHPSAAELLPVRPPNAKPEDRVFSVTSRSSNRFRRMRDWTAADREFSAAMMGSLVAFARSGSPRTNELNWMSFDPENPALLELGRTVQAGHWPDPRKLEFFREMQSR